MSPYADRLKDYVEVKDRIRLFYEAWPEGRLVTIQAQATNEPDGTPRIWVEAAAYRTPEDPLPGRGWSWMELPGTTSYTKGSEIENTETSAWGRAIAALGIGIAKSVGSKDEIDAKAGEAGRPARGPEIEQTDTGGLIGTAELGKSNDTQYELRQEKTRGHVIGFRLVSGRKGFKVLAFGPLAQALSMVRDEVIGKRVTAWGTMQEESFPKKDPDGTTRTIKYNVLHLDRLETPTFLIPRDEAADAPPADDRDDESLDELADADLQGIDDAMVAAGR